MLNSMRALLRWLLEVLFPGLWKASPARPPAVTLNKRATPHRPKAAPPVARTIRADDSTGSAACLAYRRADRVLSRGECALWNPLWRAVKGRYRIFCKVRLSDV